MHLGRPYAYWERLNLAGCCSSKWLGWGNYPADFFDLIVIDERHRGGANNESNWRAIFEYCAPAVQVGLAATPSGANVVTELTLQLDHSVGAGHEDVQHFVCEMIVELYKIEKIPERLIRRWNELLDASSFRTSFLSHHFCAAVQTVHGHVFVLHFREDDGAEGFLPFQLRKGRTWLGHAEKPGGDLSDYYGVIGNTNGYLDNNQVLRTARLSSLRIDHAIPSLCPLALSDLEYRRGVILRVGDFKQFKDHLAANNRKFANSVLSRERQLSEEFGTVRHTWKVRDPVTALRTIIDAKRDQFRRTGVKDIFEVRWHVDLLRCLLELPPSARCEPVLSTLDVNGTWVASKLSLLCLDTLHSWFSVYNPAFRRFGPGHLLWFKTIETACRKGVRSFDFGEGDGGYKDEYSGETYELLKGVIRRTGPLGWSEKIMQSIQWRFERRFWYQAVKSEER